jgi:hypothetical protein
MFEAVTIRPQYRYSQDPIDIGFLFECLLFYRRVYVQGNHFVLEQLVKYFGPEVLMELMSSGTMEMLYEEDHLAIHSTTDQSGFAIHNPVTFSAPHRALPEQLRSTLINYYDRAGKGRRAAIRMQPFIKTVHYDATLLDGVKASFRDKDFVEQAVRSLLFRWVPEVPPTHRFRFSCEETEKGFVVSTDLDFAVLNEFFHRRISKDRTVLTPAHLLSTLSDAESHAFVSARQLSEIATDEVGSDLLKLRLSHLFNRTQKSERARNDFSEVIFGEARSLREAINAGTIPMPDLIRLIKKADKFKSWLEKQSMDRDLMREYYKEVARETFLDRLPPKSMRFGIFTGAGFAVDALFPTGLATTAALGLGLFDSFLLDKFTRGWRPNQFIEGELQPVFKKNP